MINVTPCSQAQNLVVSDCAASLVTDSAQLERLKGDWGALFEVSPTASPPLRLGVGTGMVADLRARLRRPRPGFADHRYSSGAPTHWDPTPLPEVRRRSLGSPAVEIHLHGSSGLRGYLHRVPRFASPSRHRSGLCHGRRSVTDRQEESTLGPDRYDGNVRSIPVTGVARASRGTGCLDLAARVQEGFVLHLGLVGWIRELLEAAFSRGPRRGTKTTEAGRTGRDGL